MYTSHLQVRLCLTVLFASGCLRLGALTGADFVLTCEVGNRACSCILRIHLPLHMVASVGSDLQEQTDMTAAFLCHSSGNFAGLLNVLVEVGCP